MVLIFGLMATGKTTLARALGQALGLPVIETDRVRKTLAGLAPTTRATEAFGQGSTPRIFRAAPMRRCAVAARTWLRGRASSWTAPISGPGNGNWCGNWPGSTRPQCFSFTASAPGRGPPAAAAQPRGPPGLLRWPPRAAEAQVQDFDPLGRRTGPCWAGHRPGDRRGHWPPTDDVDFIVGVKLSGQDRSGLLNEITHAISTYNNTNIVA